MKQASVKEATRWFKRQLNKEPYEEPPGSNNSVYNRHYGYTGAPWCAMFIWDGLAHHLGITIIKSAYTPTMAQWFTDQKRGFINDAEAIEGDIAFFNFPDSLDRIQHVEYVEKNDTKRKVLHTIGGNTSSGIFGSQDDGGGVYPRLRNYNDAVYFGRPVYRTVIAKPPRFEVPKIRTWLHVGDEGADVKALQIDLNQWMADLRASYKARKKAIPFDFGKLKVNGTFNRDTKRALQTFQMQHPRIEPDGVFGRETERVLEAVRKRQEAA